MEKLILALKVVFNIRLSRNATQVRLIREKDAKLVKIEACLLQEVRCVEAEQARLEREVGHLKASCIGEEQLHLHRACRLLLNFMASEMSEMICSVWCMIMLPILYYSSNKKYFYTIDELDDAGFKQALTFSAVDIVLEAATFAFMLVVFALHANIFVAAVGVEYVHRKDLFLSIFGMGVVVTAVSFAFFVKHYGVDPEFKLEKFQGNVTAL
ncbi:hypothetical protein TrVE_jg11902 [Triparma verrucosa]|uniref:Uncharacterized protein n=1 Tax=Triparma verrucosa TaxID=1606542 RepID=A0A9W7EQW9_9STRA|nr:hypothetical protein TrVE_jg11902 [Triparma verrucosa]